MNSVKLWREKKRKAEAGILTQVCVWAPLRVADLVRRICERVAEPTDRGESLRKTLEYQVNRRRTVVSRFVGAGWTLEFDAPVPPNLFGALPKGGRLFTSSAHIELSPQQASDLQAAVGAALDSVVKGWLKNHDMGRGRDASDTHVVIGSQSVAALKKEDQEFYRSEARIASALVREGKKSPSRTTKPAADIFLYEGIAGYPSYCKIVHRKKADSVQFGFIAQPDAGTLPSQMFDELATLAHRKFYPDVEPSSICWYDISPEGLMGTSPLPGSFCRVLLKYQNGIYRNPQWTELNLEIAAEKEFLDFAVKQAKSSSREGAK